MNGNSPLPHLADADEGRGKGYSRKFTCPSISVSGARIFRMNAEEGPGMQAWLRTGIQEDSEGEEGRRRRRGILTEPSRAFAVFCRKTGCLGGWGIPEKLTEPLIFPGER